jgi:hypothetical protein
LVGAFNIQTEEKRQIILSFLNEEWDEKTLSWKMAVYPEKPKDVVPAQSFWSSFGNPIDTLPCGNPIEALLGNVHLSKQSATDEKAEGAV